MKYRQSAAAPTVMPMQRSARRQLLKTNDRTVSGMPAATQITLSVSPLAIRNYAVALAECAADSTSENPREISQWQMAAAMPSNASRKSTGEISREIRNLNMVRDLSRVSLDAGCGKPAQFSCM